MDLLRCQNLLICSLNFHLEYGFAGTLQGPL